MRIDSFLIFGIIKSLKISGDMDQITLFITIILFAIIFFIVISFFSVITRVKNQTIKAKKEIEDQIKKKLVERAVEAGIKASKHLYKNAIPVLKSIAKNIPFKFWQNPKTKETKTKKTKTKETKK
jgi:uncharacterized membrane protein